MKNNIIIHFYVKVSKKDNNGEAPVMREFEISLQNRTLTNDLKWCTLV